MESVEEILGLGDDQSMLVLEALRLFKKGQGAIALKAGRLVAVDDGDGAAQLLHQLGSTDRVKRRHGNHVIRTCVPSSTHQRLCEVMINAPMSIFCKRHSGDNGYHDDVFRD